MKTYVSSLKSRLYRFALKTHESLLEYRLYRFAVELTRPIVKKCRKLIEMYRDAEIAIITKVMVTFWILTGFATPFAIASIPFWGNWTFVYLVTPNEVALVPFIASNPLWFVFTVGWARKIGFKPSVYEAASYMVEPLPDTGSEESQAIKWWKRGGFVRLVLRAAQSRSSAHLILCLVVISPSNATVGIAAKLNVGKAKTVAAVAIGGLIRISLGVWASDTLIDLVASLSSLRPYLITVVTFLVAVKVIMAIRVAWRHT